MLCLSGIGEYGNNWMKTAKMVFLSLLVLNELDLTHKPVSGFQFDGFANRINVAFTGVFHTSRYETV